MSSFLVKIVSSILSSWEKIDETDSTFSLFEVLLKTYLIDLPVILIFSKGLQIFLI